LKYDTGFAVLSSDMTTLLGGINKRRGAAIPGRDDILPAG